MANKQGETIGLDPEEAVFFIGRGKYLVTAV